MHDLARNKELVRDYIYTILHDRDPEKAIKLQGRRYIQHSFNVEDGKEGLIKHLKENVLGPHPRMRVRNLRLIAEDDLVVAHYHHIFDTADPDDRGANAMDIFRVDSTGIIEHWYVWMAIPDKLANPNSPF